MFFKSVPKNKLLYKTGVRFFISEHYHKQYVKYLLILFLNSLYEHCYRSGCGNLEY